MPVRAALCAESGDLKLSEIETIEFPFVRLHFEGPLKIRTNGNLAAVKIFATKQLAKFAEK